MEKIFIAAAVVAIILYVMAFYCLTSCEKIREERKLMWFALVIFLPIVGSLAYFTVEKPWMKSTS